MNMSHLSPFNLTHQVDKVNPTQVHVEGSFEPPLKKSKTLFIFMPEPEAETIPSRVIQTQTNIVSPCISIVTDPAKY